MDYDVIVVGSGIVGLAHAYEGARRGLSVCVIERDTRCVGASIRNFGFITVTGQGAGDTHRRAKASRNTWAEIAPQAGIEVVHRGLWLAAKRPAAVAVLEEFMTTEMAEGCELATRAQALSRAPELNGNAVAAALYSPHELRVESRVAIPQLVGWLSDRWGVEFRFGETVVEIAPPMVCTSYTELSAERIVMCPGSSLSGPLADRIGAHRLVNCKLQMQRIRPAAGFRLSAAVMAELSLVRYRGYSRLDSASALLAQLQVEEAEAMAHGIHLIAVQSADGTLIVGDSHHYHASPDPFSSQTVDELIQRHLQATLNLPASTVVERWVGEYPYSATQDAIIDEPDPFTRLVMVTSGTGASTAFGLAADVFNQW